jgi:hypothetical protein
LHYILILFKNATTEKKIIGDGADVSFHLILIRISQLF